MTRPSMNNSIILATRHNSFCIQEDERRWRDEDGPVNSASQKLIRPLPVQDSKGERFQRPALPFAGARRRSGWRRARYTHEPAPYQAKVHQSPTNQGLGPNSTQKTSLMGEDFPTLYVVLPHHQFPMWD